MNSSLKKYVAGLSLLGLMTSGSIPSSTVFATNTTKNVKSISVESLSEQQKEDYYKEYVEIIKEVVVQHPEVSMEIVPFDKFVEKDWVTPEKFRQLAIERINLNFSKNLVQSVPSTPSTTATKSRTLNAKDVIGTLNITGSFQTQLEGSRQMFAGINSLTSKTTSGSWTQTGYTPELIDGGRTYAIYVGGKYTLNGITTSHNVYMEFYCNSFGSVG